MYDDEEDRLVGRHYRWGSRGKEFSGRVKLELRVTRKESPSEKDRSEECERECLVTVGIHSGLRLRLVRENLEMVSEVRSHGTR